jgi:hypothetical protein
MRTCATTHAPSDEPPHNGEPHRSLLPHCSTLRALPDTAVPRHSTPRSPAPTPSIRERTQTPVTEKADRQHNESVRQLPESLSPSYRSRVPKLSPTYRSHTVQHEPDSHKSSLASCRHVVGTARMQPHEHQRENDDLAGTSRERVTGIEPAFSAWEASDRSHRYSCLPGSTYPVRQDVGPSCNIHATIEFRRIARRSWAWAKCTFGCRVAGWLASSASVGAGRTRRMARSSQSPGVARRFWPDPVQYHERVHVGSASDRRRLKPSCNKRATIVGGIADRTPHLPWGTLPQPRHRHRSHRIPPALLRRPSKRHARPRALSSHDRPHRRATRLATQRLGRVALIGTHGG